MMMILFLNGERGGRAGAGRAPSKKQRRRKCPPPRAPPPSQQQPPEQQQQHHRQQHQHQQYRKTTTTPTTATTPKLTHALLLPPRPPHASSPSFRASFFFHFAREIASTPFSLPPHPAFFPFIHLRLYTYVSTLNGIFFGKPRFLSGSVVLGRRCGASAAIVQKHDGTQGGFPNTVFTTGALRHRARARFRHSTTSPNA